MQLKFITRRCGMLRGGFVKRAKCPKCGGKVYLDSDMYGWYEQCLQCGHTQNLEKVSPVNIETGDKYTAEPAQSPALINK
jgi:hypothetical protein